MSSNVPENFLQENYIIPEPESDVFEYSIRNYFNRIAFVLNQKVNGDFISEEVFSGQRFLPTFSQNTNQSATYPFIYRKTIDLGGLPSSGTKTVAHGISTTEEYKFVKIYGAATEPGGTTITSALPLPYINVMAPANSVQLKVSSTNIDITVTTGDYAVYTKAYAIVEYTKS